MEYENIIKWLQFVERMAVNDLKEIINEDLYLDEHLKNVEKSQVNQLTLNSIKTKLQGSKIENLFWEKTLLFISIESLKDELIEYFINNKIALDILGHLPLPDKHLRSIANVSEEAVVTLGKRYYIEDKYMDYEFEKFINDYTNCYALWSTILSLRPSKNKKRKILIKRLFLNTDFDDLKKRVIEENKEKTLIKTKKIEMIEECYKTRKEGFLKAIAQNPATPQYILTELAIIKNVKYANIIRGYANRNLEMQKKH